MSRNMTVCPECGADFETIKQIKEMPLQALTQQCPDCDYIVHVGIINYGTTFEVVAPALKGDTCDEATCEQDAMIRTQRAGYGVGGRCADHMGAHRESSLDLRSSL